MDTITDFDFAIEGDTVDLDKLFDALGVDPADRAGDISISAGSDAVLTVTGNAGFSITFSGVDLGGDGNLGQFDAAALALKGIIVSDV
jgi:hypothetical protein